MDKHIILLDNIGHEVIFQGDEKYLVIHKKDWKKFLERVDKERRLHERWGK